MNTPLRHEGKTFYQYQMNKAADYTVFQVVRNPSWLVPYIACILVSIGLLWQFSFTWPISQQKFGKQWIGGMTEKKKSIRLRILSFVLILSGIYFVFFPNRYTSLSIFDFFKGEKISSEEIINLDAFPNTGTSRWAG